MASRTRPTTERVDGDGVRIVQTPGVRGPVWLLALAIGLVGLALLIVFRPNANRQSETTARSSAPQPVVRQAEPIHAAAAPAKPLRPPSVAHDRVVEAPAPARAEPPAASAENAPPQDAEPPSQDDPVFGKEPASEGTGIALFPPPGTKPIKRGIVVPEDFELPPGYVRHYQATDDGQRVPAILMFHPDYKPIDEQGRPVQLPADRVVPPDMVPPGLPLQMLEVPDNAEQTGEGRAAQEPGQ